MSSQDEGGISKSTDGTKKHLGWWAAYPHNQPNPMPARVLWGGDIISIDWKTTVFDKFSFFIKTCGRGLCWPFDLKYMKRREKYYSVYMLLKPDVT
jgi:hypothetical protein